MKTNGKLVAEKRWSLTRGGGNRRTVYNMIDHDTLVSRKRLNVLLLAALLTIYSVKAGVNMNRRGI